jgi:hypothetical protein
VVKPSQLRAIAGFGRPKGSSGLRSTLTQILVAFGLRKEDHMLGAHTASFLKLINATLEDTSRGVASSHHLHNVRCGVENIMSLLEFNNDVVEKAERLSRRARDYITYHDLVTSKISGVTIGEEVDRLRAARDALADFRSAVEQSQPNSRVRKLGLS